MIAFESLEVAYGWKLSGIPDEVSVEVVGDDTRKAVWGSVTDFLEVYARVRLERPGEVDIGSSAFADVGPDRVRMHAADLEATATLAEARNSLRTLVAQIFEAKDQYDDDHQRDAALEAIQDTLADRGVDVDVRALYDSLDEA